MTSIIVNNIVSVEPFPNPTKGDVFLPSSNNKPISIIDQSSKMIKKKYADVNGKVDLSDLNPGIYLMRSDDRIFRIIKE